MMEPSRERVSIGPGRVYWLQDHMGRNAELVKFEIKKLDWTALLDDNF